MSDIRIRDETQKTKDRSTAKPGDSLQIPSSSTNPQVACTISNGVVLPFRRDVENEGLCLFFDLISTPRHFGDGGPLLALPQIYCSARADSPVLPITSAVALLFFSRFFRSSQHKFLAEKLFCEALRRLRKAVGDPAAVRGDDTLMAITLCGTWEGFRASIQSTNTWSEHTKGKLAVVKIRGAEMQMNRTSRLLLRGAISDLVLTKLAQRLPVELPSEILGGGK